MLMRGKNGLYSRLVVLRGKMRSVVPMLGGEKKFKEQKMAGIHIVFLGSSFKLLYSVYGISLNVPQLWPPLNHIPPTIYPRSTLRPSPAWPIKPPLLCSAQLVSLFAVNYFVEAWAVKFAWLRTNTVDDIARPNKQYPNPQGKWTNNSPDVSRHMCSVYSLLNFPPLLPSSPVAHRLEADLAAFQMSGDIWSPFQASGPCPRNPRSSAAATGMRHKVVKVGFSDLYCVLRDSVRCRISSHVDESLNVAPAKNIHRRPAL